MRRRARLARFVVAALVVVVGGCAASDESSPSSPLSRSSPSSSASAPAGAADEVALVISPPKAMPTAPPRLRVLVGGDLIPHRPSLVQPASIRAALAPLTKTFASADAVIANYEAATGDVDGTSFRLAYAAPPDWIGELARAGIRAVTVANNHACDLGASGVEATLAAAKAGGALALGGDREDPWAARTIAEVDGKRVCAVAWTTLINAEGGCARTKRLAIAPLDRAGRQRIDAAVARAQSSCDATIAILHGGEEYVSQIPAVMDQAKHAAEAGADAVIIHHPHVPSPVVVHAAADGRRVPIFASVGNLASNQGESWQPSMFPVLRENRRLVCVNGWTRLGVLADLSFVFDQDAVRLDWGFHLTWTENEHAHDRKVAVPKIETRLLESERDAEIVARLADDANGPVELFDDPCWIERAVLTNTEAAADPRCVVTTPKGLPAAQPLAFGTRARAKKAAGKGERTRR